MGCWPSAESGNENREAVPGVVTHARCMLEVCGIISVPSFANIACVATFINSESIPAGTVASIRA